MGRRGRRAVAVAPTQEQLAELRRLVRSRKTNPRVRLRARIVLGAAGGRSNRELAAALACHETTVSRWRARFAEEGLAGLWDRAVDRAELARRGRPLAELTVTAAQREVLERWSRRRTTAAGLAQRARIVLAAAEGSSNVEVAQMVGCTAGAVGKWRARFVAQGLEGLSDEYRPGGPRRISDKQVEQVVVKTLEDLPPDGSTRWSSRSMAVAVGLSQLSVIRIWHAFGLKPHCEETLEIATDPDFVDKVHDVVGLYLNPPERAVVVCVDEKTAIHALDHIQAFLPLPPRSRARGSHDYIRYDSITLLGALGVGSGTVIAHTDTRDRAIEFERFLDLVAVHIPAGLDAHLVLDNLSTHKTPAIQRWLTRHPHFAFHLAPTSSAWLNLVELRFPELTNKELRRSADHHNTRELANDIIGWAETWNDNPRPFVWHKTADEILQNLSRYLQRISGSRL